MEQWEGGYCGREKKENICKYKTEGNYCNNGSCPHKIMYDSYYITNQGERLGGDELPDSLVGLIMIKARYHLNTLDEM
ncbi:MAG: hypothetical protein KKA64_02575 [Nanoarchaeota archaeon]|nr:hypothetical protein [Nanoarchaeota archaeon]